MRGTVVDAWALHLPSPVAGVSIVVRRCQPPHPPNGLVAVGNMGFLAGERGIRPAVLHSATCDKARVRWPRGSPRRFRRRSSPAGSRTGSLLGPRSSSSTPSTSAAAGGCSCFGSAVRCSPRGWWKRGGVPAGGRGRRRRGSPPRAGGGRAGGGELLVPEAGRDRAMDGRASARGRSVERIHGGGRAGRGEAIHLDGARQPAPRPAAGTSGGRGVRRDAGSARARRLAP